MPRITELYFAFLQHFDTVLLIFSSFQQIESLAARQLMHRMTQPEQLNLFTWDFVRLGEGYDALEKLDLKRAQQAFTDIIEKIQDHQDAHQGLTLCYDWLPLLKKKKRLGQITASEFLWKVVTEYHFGTTPLALTLKKALLKKLARDLEHIDPHLFSDSGLCLGQIFRELEDYSRAVATFAPLLEYYPYEPQLLIHYGNALWQAEKKIQAKINYIKALLIAPSEVGSLPIDDEAIACLVETEGPYMAPVYEWLYHGMPPLGLPKIQGENLEHLGALEIFYLLVQVNKLKTKGDHAQMVAFRKELQIKAPDIFAAYMAQIKTA